MTCHDQGDGLDNPAVEAVFFQQAGNSLDQGSGEDKGFDGLGQGQPQLGERQTETAATARIRPRVSGRCRGSEA